MLPPVLIWYAKKKSGSRFEATYYEYLLVQTSYNNYWLFQANYGTVYASRFNGSKAITGMVFRALGTGNSISVQRTTVRACAYSY